MYKSRSVYRFGIIGFSESRERWYRRNRGIGMKAGEIIETLLKQTSFTITDLSNNSEVNRWNIYKILNGQSDPSFDTVVRLLRGANYILCLIAPDTKEIRIASFKECVDIILWIEHITQVALAERTGKSVTTIGRYARDIHSPRFSNAINILEKMGYRLIAYDKCAPCDVLHLCGDETEGRV